MATFPSLNYTLEGYSYEVAPQVTRTQFYTGNSRQRRVFKKRDDTFNIRMVLSDAELVTFESFVNTDLDNGSLTYTAPYYTSDVEYTGTMELVDGTYQADLVPPSSWAVSFSAELKDRDLTAEETIYDNIIAAGGFDEYWSLLDALENMVNNNNL
jgi:hypothetical protein